jgi:hypothetical protein
LVFRSVTGADLADWSHPPTKGMTAANTSAKARLQVKWTRNFIFSVSAYAIFRSTSHQIRLLGITTYSTRGLIPCCPKVLCRREKRVALFDRHDNQRKCSVRLFREVMRAFHGQITR